jgi:Zn-dependent peptidase ImmA (M78 family)
VTWHEYYESMKELARVTRREHGITSSRVRRSDMRRVFGKLGIRVDLWPWRFKKVRGAYFSDDAGPTVMLAKALPPDPMIFTMAHELKHHLADSIATLCLATPSESDQCEIGAEVFAAEFLFPEADFDARLAAMGVDRGRLVAESLVRLKVTSRTSLSYAGLIKRAVFRGYCKPGALDAVGWKALERKLYGGGACCRDLESAPRI